MNEIIYKKKIAEDIVEIKFRNPLIAEKFKPGQFIVVHNSKKSERIPLTIVGVEGDALRLIIQEVGYTTKKLSGLIKGDSLIDVAGPLGKPSEIENFGDVVCISGGIGAAPLLPVAGKLKRLGNRVTVIEGVRSKSFLILEEELREIADEFIPVSDDGSFGRKGLVTKPFKELLKNSTPDYVFAVGPAVMMHAVSKITSENNIPLTVSLNPIMVDGTGMCGSCRVEIGGETKFACVDGPEFDGNKVNFKLLIKRLIMYEKEENIIKDNNQG
ncbi:MAG: sulfide/dihydroorotate dehydrogenase-like FAD/NAD-binding protein [Elusimicrobia bacterium]|jgi:NAD(P)H-flavin reductase|nr:sulfide/dihydroorotate dehydrogenase-like FAD/NAD-binding protein [Elusimicrobiota bacterium]